jgi:hypothetical protein
MSFQTFNLFNFFQQPNTGEIPKPDSFGIIPLNIDSLSSGKVADYNWSFPYIDRSIPSEIFESNQGGVFPINLFSDTLFQNIIGIRRPSFFNNVSGEFYKDTNKQFTNLSVSGNFFSHKKDFSNLQITLSGEIKQNLYEFYLFKNYISGEILSGNSNFNVLDQKISGKINDLKTNFNQLKINVSGEAKDFSSLQNYFNLKISGNFFPLKKDLANIEYKITGYSAQKNIERYFIEKSDEITSLNYYINEYNVGGI